MKDAEQIIKNIEREKTEEREIIAALEARNFRLETMTDDEKKLIGQLQQDEAKAWDFLDL